MKISGGHLVYLCKVTPTAHTAEIYGKYSMSLYASSGEEFQFRGFFEQASS